MPTRSASLGPRSTSERLLPGAAAISSSVRRPSEASRNTRACAMLVRCLARLVKASSWTRSARIHHAIHRHRKASISAGQLSINSSGSSIADADRVNRKVVVCGRLGSRQTRNLRAAYPSHPGAAHHGRRARCTATRQTAEKGPPSGSRSLEGAFDRTKLCTEQRHRVMVGGVGPMLVDAPSDRRVGVPASSATTLSGTPCSISSEQKSCRSPCNVCSDQAGPARGRARTRD